MNTPHWRGRPTALTLDSAGTQVSTIRGVELYRRDALAERARQNGKRLTLKATPMNTRSQIEPGGRLVIEGGHRRGGPAHLKQGQGGELCHLALSRWATFPPGCDWLRLKTMPLSSSLTAHRICPRTTVGYLASFWGLRLELPSMFRQPTAFAQTVLPI